MKKVTKRNHTFDILRIIAMLMIIIHHIIINDVGLQPRLTGAASPLTSMQTAVCIFINSFVIVGVNLFFLLSGFFGIKYDKRKFFSFVIEIFLVYLFVTGIGALTGNVPLTVDTFIGVLNPFGLYWYLCVYAIIMLLAPMLNKFVKAITKKDARRLILITVLVFSLYSTFFDHVLNFNHGYSLIWGILLYITGALIHKYRFKLRLGWLYYLICSAVNAVIICLLCRFGHSDLGWNLFAYNNILVFGASISLFAFFASIKKEITRPKLISTITFFASNTLMVYLLHSTCFLTMYRKMPTTFSLEHLGFIPTILLIPLYAIFILTICSIVSVIYNKTIGKVIIDILSDD